MPYNSWLATSLDLAEEVMARYDLDALSGLLTRARALAGGAEISVAVLGRFKAGKSSFLNHFLGRNFLPVGVVPVTAVGYVLVAVVGKVLLNEQITMKRWTGIGLIVAGVALVSGGSAPQTAHPEPKTAEATP